MRVLRKRGRLECNEKRKETYRDGCVLKEEEEKKLSYSETLNLIIYSSASWRMEEHRRDKERGTK